MNICASTMVSNSKNINFSTNVFDSMDIINCNSVTNSYFCKNCSNISNCLFCFGLEDAEYCVFNIPIDKKRFEVIKEQYQKYQTELLSFVETWPENMFSNHTINTIVKFDIWYYPIPQKFWKWVRTLPGFDPMLIYNITMLPEILVD